MLTKKNIFFKEKYKLIGKLINYGEKKTKKGIENKYLKYALVKETNYTDYERNRYNKYFSDRIFFEIKKDIIPPKKPFDTEVNLKKHLQNMRKLGIIESISPKKGFSYWRFTEIGISVYLKYLSKRIIDDLNQRKNLVYTNQVLLDFLILEKSGEKVSNFK